MSLISKDQMLFIRAAIFFKYRAYRHTEFNKYIVDYKEFQKTGKLNQSEDLYKYAEELAELVKELMSEYTFDFETYSDLYADTIITSPNRKNIISKAKDDYFIFVSAQKAVARYYSILGKLRSSGGKFEDNGIIYEMTDSNTITYFSVSKPNSKKYSLGLSEELKELALNCFCGNIERPRIDRTFKNSFKTKSIYVFSVWVLSHFTGIPIGKSDNKKGIDDGKNCCDIISKVNPVTYKSVINNWKLYGDIANDTLINFDNTEYLD